MPAHPARRTVLFTIIITCGFLLPTLLVTPVIPAETTQGETTFYFHQYDPETGEGTLDQNLPAKENDSAIPPTITSEEFPAWALMWFVSIQLRNELEQMLNDPEFQQGLNDSGMTLEQYLALIEEALGLFNPFEVKESYTYLGDTSVDVTGDIRFHLYLSSFPRLREKFRDNIQVTVYANSKKVANTTITPASSIFDERIQAYTIPLENVDFSLDPEDIITFSVQVQLSNTTIHNIIEKIKENGTIAKLIKKVINWIPSFLQKRERFPDLQAIGEALELFMNESGEMGINITRADIADFANAVFSLHSSFIYDSIAHPSSVTIPARISQEDIHIYYLHAGDVMDEKFPGSGNSSDVKITGTPVKWAGPSLERNKILKIKNSAVDLFFDYRDIFGLLDIFRGKLKITATMYDGATALASSERELDRTGLLDLIRTPDTPITFLFTGDDHEIPYGHNISLSVSLSNGTKLAGRSIKLLYDSTEVPSALTVKYEETKNIIINKMSVTPANGKIIPGGTVTYTFNISSIYEDVIEVDSIIREEDGAWNVTVEPASVSIPAAGSIEIQILLTSGNTYKEAYGDATNRTIIISGKTGIARRLISAEVSEDAIQYKVEILGYSNNINIKKGENRTYYFIIKNNNTGALDDVDSYTITATSKNHWSLIPRESIRNLNRNESTSAEDARVVIQVPKNTTLDSDVITITVTSDSDNSAFASINVTVNVAGGDLIESIYDLFDSLAESLGLNDVFGSYGAIVLVTIIMVIILFLIIILALVLTSKDMAIICTERIKEIEATETATFELTLKNPRKKIQSYQIFAEQPLPLAKWTSTVEPETVTVEGRQSTTVQILVTPTQTVVPKDWTKVIVQVKKVGRKKTNQIEFMVMIMEGNTILQIGNVSHQPAEFNPGDRVITSCSVSNKGIVSARNVNVFLYVNGKQKNSVEVTIPAGSVADIQMPWIAVKGKNQVRLRLKEQ